ncbi:hypothetical protein [Actinoplanes sp. NPDC049681]|uniref:hypothetical protein n=1 Tax=Actinoplanes sp. NPDC049681 TaxID=3363905 RepID=UPI0037A98094
MPIIGVATAATIGTGVAAYGNWDVKAEAKTFTVRAASIPRMAAPDAEMPPGEPLVSGDGLVVRGPRISWRGVAIAADVPVQRYVVTRHLGPVAQVACDVPAGRTRCVDRHPPAGYLVTYTVAAAYGSYWTGLASEESRPVLLPGEAAPIIVDGVVVLPGSAGGALVPGPGPSGIAAPGTVVNGDGAAVEPGVPAPEVSTSAQAPVIVPPAPPEVETPKSDTTSEPATPAPVESAGEPPKNTPPGNAENEQDTQTGIRVDVPIASIDMP